MTKVYLAYNPFTVKTIMVVNDEQVKSTSTLYRYRNTPLLDWVESFLPELVVHCNDDEIEITFHGLQYHFDAMEKQVEAYTSKNRDTEIKLYHQVSKSQVARMGALSDIMDEIQNTQELILELKTEEINERIKNSYNTNLEILTISSIDQMKVNVIEKLLGQPVLKEGNDRGIKIIDNDQLKEMQSADSDDDFDCVEMNIPFVSSKHARLVITDTPNSLNQETRYYRYIKKAISSAEKPIILFVLDDNGSNNNEEFLHLISEQFNQKGKQNKERFIFIAENQSKAKKMLYSEYTMGNPHVFCPDDIPDIQTEIKRYMEEYCFNNKITNTFSELKLLFEELKSQLQVTEKQNMEHDLHGIFFKIKELLSLTGYQWSSPIRVVEIHVDIEIETSILIATLGNEFNSVLEISESRGLVDVKKNTKNYLENNLKKRIETFIVERVKEIIQGSRIEMIFPETLISILKEIDLEDSINPYIDPSFSNTLTKSLETMIVDAKLKETIEAIENIEVRFDGTRFVTRIERDTGLSNLGKYFLKLIAVNNHVLDSDKTYLGSAKMVACKKAFRENIAKIGPAINEKLKSVTSQLNTNLPIYDQAKTKMVEELTDQAQECISEKLGKQALRFNEVKERLAYLEQLSQKLDGITQL